jgi:hypothetical protein
MRAHPISGVRQMTMLGRPNGASQFRLINNLFSAVEQVSR